MKWSEDAWQKALPIYQSIIDMPFILELSDGTLPIEKFQFYIAQDAIYLEQFGRALALIAGRADQIRDTLSFVRFAENAAIVENILHASYFSEYGVTNASTVEPACHHYVHYLKSAAALEPLEVAMAAILPCFRIYKEVGDHICRQEYSSQHPYLKWIETYAGEEFGKAVQHAAGICDRVAAAATQSTRQRMTDAFITASRLEYDFWDGAYRIRKWR